jgi:preprotein translocase SecE subunit
LKARDNDELIREKNSLTGGNEGAETTTREKQVDTTKTAGHNPNKVQAQQKPMAHQKPTPQSEPSVFGNNLSEFIDFLKETWQEFRKISWPNRDQVIKETWSVLVLVAVITGAVLGFDWVIAKSVFEPLDRYAKKMGGGVGHTMTPFSPLQAVPGAPVNNPSIPGNALPTPHMPPAGTPAAPTGQSPVAPAPSATTPPVTSGSSTTPATPASKSELDKFTPAPAAPSNAPPTNGK